ncbi:hypothetical protein D3C72_1853730 [compost metagenome]
MLTPRLMAAACLSLMIAGCSDTPTFQRENQQYSARCVSGEALVVETRDQGRTLVISGATFPKKAVQFVHGSILEDYYRNTDIEVWLDPELRIKLKDGSWISCPT